MALPDFEMMWKAFPDHDLYPTLRSLHTFIGGNLKDNIDTPGFGENGNTCAVRMSRALNYGKLPISAKRVSTLKIQTMTGADKKLYIFRVRDMKKYLANVLPITPKKVTADFGTAFAKERGIISFDIDGWSDASGHLALWNGESFRETHDDYRNLQDNPATTRIEPSTKAMTLWKL